MCLETATGVPGHSIDGETVCRTIIGWVYLAIKPFLIIVFRVSVLFLIIAVIVAVRRKDAMYVNYGDRREALEIADSLDDEPGPR